MIQKMNEYNRRFFTRAAALTVVSVAAQRVFCKFILLI